MSARAEPLRASVRPRPLPTWSRLSAVAPPVVFLAILLLTWQLGLVHALLRLKEFQLPYPVQIAQALIDRGDVLWRDAVLFTGPEAVAGLIVGGLAGFACAVACAGNPVLRRGALPVLASLNSIPIIAIAPIAVLWLGFGQPSKIAVVALMTFAPMLVNASKGLYSIDPESVQLMISIAATPADVFWKLRLPHSLPYVFSALKVGTTLAMIGAVVSEFFNAQRGLGVDLSNNIQVAKMPIAWAAIVAAAVLGLVLFGLVSLAERALIPWHISFRQERL